jgi:acyl-CoA thioesterase YciA
MEISPMTDRSVPPDGAPAIRIIAMPADTNPSGDIFGGWLMSMMDMAGANVAFERAGGRVATVAVNEIEFHSPVLVGDLVSCYAKVVRTGRTSLATKVEVWVRGRSGGDSIKVTEGEFTFVAIDDDRVPRPLQKL